MKKIGIILSVLVCACLLLFGCTSLRTHELDDALPDVLDEYTLLPLIESVTITRQADGKQIVYYTATADLSNARGKSPRRPPQPMWWNLS